MSTSKDASKISKGVLIVMFLKIVLLICFTEVRVYGHPMFITWDDAQVFIYDKPKFHKMTAESKQVKNLRKTFPLNYVYKIKINNVFVVTFLERKIR